MTKSLRLLIGFSLFLTVSLSTLIYVCQPLKEMVAEISFQQIVSRADSLFGESRYEEAAQVFKLATEVNAEHPAPHLAYGHTLFAMGRTEEASQSLQKGVFLFPLWPQQPVELESLYKDPEIFSQRFEELKKRVEDEEKNFDRTFLLAYLYFFTGQKPLARTLFTDLLKDQPHNPLLKFFLV